MSKFVVLLVLLLVIIALPLIGGPLGLIADIIPILIAGLLLKKLSNKE